MKPAPKPTAVICEACGLPWEDHEALMRTAMQKPSLKTCVTLLRAELRKSRPRWNPPYLVRGSSPATINYGTFEGYSTSSATDSDD